jgi:hypothetical protein
MKYREIRIMSKNNNELKIEKSEKTEKLTPEYIRDQFDQVLQEFLEEQNLSTLDRVILKNIG